MMSKTEDNSTFNNHGNSITDDIKPHVSERSIPDLVKRLYGFKVTEIKELPSYYDLNFYIQVDDTYENKHVKTVNKDGYVFKILNTLESSQPDNVETQHALFKYLRRRGMTAQTPILNTEGQEWSLETFIDLTDVKMTEFGPYLVRLFTFIPGKTFEDIPFVPESLFNIGKYVGRLHQEMQGFHHNIPENHTNLWTFHKTSTLRDFTDILNCEADVDLVEEVVEAYERNVLPNFDKFTEGVIHGDLNEQNIIVQEVPGQYDTPLDQRVLDVSALIDFSDVSFAYIVFDVAICICYLSMIFPDKQQSDVGGHILAGYYQTCTLNKEEFDSLKILICARLCQSLIYGMHANKQQPENKYLLISQKCGWQFLYKLWKMPSKLLHERWKEVISQY